MKLKLLTTISFFTYQLSISQTEKLLHGKVISNNSPLNKVEVINKTAQTSTRTNERGEFSILVKAKDSLLFFSKDYLFARLKITAKEIETNNLIIDMIPKAEELDEVVILDKKTTSIKLSKEEILQIKLNSHKPKEGLKIQGFYEVKGGPLDIDFIYLGKQVYYLLKKENEKPKPKIKKIEFVQLIRNTINPDFFDKDLKLKPEEKELFLQFCDADPQSKIISENPNILSVTDFLNAKNEEFRKLNSAIKN
ncbi:carboxypeptidase-like regulatory domain-containing protein [Flavobacterium sp. FlaQc-30]|uniref:carboxypeptidase-like regulatory domain-containing protein n=1 Tax=Flavobacterium sp. FlaQc-30 TaxID=3374179 RepID=UPI003756B3BC